MVYVRIEDLEDYAFHNNIPIMQKDGIEFLIKYIKENNVKSILEIGTAIGYSAIRMALVSNDVKVTTIEKDKDRYSLALTNIKEFGLQNNIEVINEDALLTNIDKKYDLIFIDAAKAQYIKFFERFKDNLNENGVIVSDNLSFHGLVDDVKKTNNRNTKQLVRKIKNYIEYLKNNKEFTTTFYSLGDGVSVSIRNKLLNDSDK